MAYDFPNSPTIGQIANGYTWDGEKWVSTYNAPNTSGVIAIKVFTVNGTYVPSPNMTTCVVECWGGGGGGGGSGGATGASYVGGGGGGGGYSRSTLTAAQIGVSKAVVIGAAGAAGGLTTAGGNGGNTTFGSTIVVANGGGGGVGSAPSQGATPGAAAGTGDFTAPGPNASSAFGDTGAGQTITVGAVGASTAVGGGGGCGLASSNGSAGSAARGYAAGGGGGCTNRAATNVGGGAGAPGLCVITEYGMTALDGTSATSGAVRYDLTQSLTANQQAQARANIAITKKNYIINGAMMISQENGATSINVLGYPIDCFKYVAGGPSPGQCTVAQVASASPAGSPNRLRVTVSTVDTTVNTTETFYIYQAIEGFRFADLRAGNAAAKTVTLQFGIRAPAGTYCVSLRNGPADRVYLVECVVAAGEANTDVIKSITIPLDTTGTWPVDNSAAVYVSWNLMTGPTFQSPTVNSWHAGNFYTTPNQTNFMGTINNVFELFDVSLTEGSVAPPFQVPDYASELAMCERYYFSCRDFAGLYGMISYAAASTSVGSWFNFPARMRATPTVATVGTWFYSNASGITVGSSNELGVNMFITATATGTAQSRTIPGTGYFTASARL